VTVAVIFDELGLMTVTVPAAWLATYIAVGVTTMSNGFPGAQVNASGDAVALGIDRGHVARAEHSGGVMMAY
jgi:hypothetical protein